MDHAAQPRVIIEPLVPKDLAGAMLRRSFSRRPNKNLYWPPMRAVIAAFLTAGLSPSGLLIYRLWRYATHQRFRAGELARWLRDLQVGGESPAEPFVKLRKLANGASPATLNLSSGPFAVALGIWAAALLLCAAALSGFAPRALVCAAIAAASMFQMLLVFQMRMNVQLFLDRLNAGATIRRASDIPIWSLWPASLALLSIPAKLAGFQFAAMWIVTATAAVLASEIQRGYITVADRHLRLSVARAIGSAMYSEARR